MSSEDVLKKIKSTSDLKKLSLNSLNELCDEIREKIVSVVSKNGGHLASNLGVVELTVALHRVFNTPNDKIVWDVGHQCYTHKMLTGRYKDIDTIRKKGGLSGFTKRSESEYDSFNSGHSSTSISAAYGLVQAKSISGGEGKVIAVIGDGALTGGLAYEGLNNAGRFKKNFIVILNDNKMSISRNVGSMAKYLSMIRMKSSYIKAKRGFEKALIHTPLVGKGIRSALMTSKSVLKDILYKSTLFEDMGFVYYGPYDGHNVKELIDIFTTAKNINKPILIHVITKKGKGYQFAEKNPKVFHGISSFDIKTGLSGESKTSFSDCFGLEILKLSNNDNRICAITAAMKLGTGLLPFAHENKDRFFDVGIAEEHAITFAGGLAAGGMLPVFAVYSSFLQRSYDQIIHDAAIQNLKIILAIDRAGIVGEDGETHQGIFDIPMLNSIPNVTIYAPSFFDELRIFLRQALYETNSVAAIRYPRGGELYKPNDFKITGNSFDIYGDKNSNILLVTFGRIFSIACIAKEKLKTKGIEVCILKLNKIKPLDIESINYASGFKNILFFEESIKLGGIGEHFGFNLFQNGFKGKYIINAINNIFVQHASVGEILKDLNMDTEGMIDVVLRECK